jgi:glucokinase-like ROK family protein
VYKIIDQLMETACQPMVGIGVGTPGLVDTNEGVVINAVNLDWKNLPLAHLLKERYHLPVYILNDSQAAAIGEYTYAQGHQTDSNLIVINVRQGIGAGIVVNGHLFQGDGGAAGEIGHVVVVPEGGLLCRCGNYGCLETVASAQAIIKRAQLLVRHTPGTLLPGSPQDIDLDTIEKAYNAGDPLARQVVLEAGRYMGLAISNLVGTLNIHKIVLAGVMTCFGEPWLEAIRESMFRATLSKLAQDTLVEIGQLGGNGIILGASALLANDYALLFSRQSNVNKIV